jgi:hypothetical protein
LFETEFSVIDKPLSQSVSGTILAGISAVALTVAFSGVVFGQSLADLARQERARTSREGKSGKVYTNDDVSRLPAPTNPPAATADSSKDTAERKPDGADAAKGDAKAPADAKPAGKSEAELEKEYRDKFAKLRDDLKTQEEKLDVMQRELNLMQTQFYSDPNAALREQTFRTQINDRTQAIEQQKAAVTKAKEEIAKLEDELRKNDLPPGWAR